MSKKIIIILSFVVLLFLIILGVIFFFVRTTPTPDENILSRKIREIFPFGKPARDNDTLFPGETTEVKENNDDFQNDQTSKTPRLRKIYEYPVAGSLLFSIINSKKETESFIRFVDRATGHVSEATPFSLSISKISNTTITKTYEALFASENSFLGRFLDSLNDDIIKTYSITLREKPKPLATSTPINTIPKESIGTYLEEGIKELVVSPKGDKIAYLVYENDGGSIIISNINGTNKRKIYSSPLREWLLYWQNENTLVIQTKPSGFTVGFAYSLNTVTGVTTKIVGNIAGMTILPNKISSSYLLGQGGNSLSLFSLKQLNGQNNINLLAKTLPEKCVWAKTENSIIYCAVPTNIPNGVYPDYWYQGKISFNDALWKINTETATTNMLSIPIQDSGENIDAFNLQISSDDSYLTFQNKKDLSLWGLILKEKIATSTSTSTPSAR